MYIHFQFYKGSYYPEKGLKCSNSATKIVYRVLGFKVFRALSLGFGVTAIGSEQSLVKLAVFDLPKNPPAQRIS